MVLPLGILGLVCAFFSTIGATSSEEEQIFVSQEEFEEFKQEMNSKLDMILEALAKDGPFVNTLRGMPGRPGTKGQPGIQGPPGPQGPIGPTPNLNQVTTRLAEAEKILKKVHPEDLRDHVFTGTQEGGIQVYSEKFNDVQIFVESSEDLEGVAWDDENQKLYYCSDNKIYRANQDGTGIQTVFSNSSYGDMKGLAVDFITGNVYAVTWGGYVIACNRRATGQLKCYAVLKDQGSVNGIALNPNAGFMYFTTYEGTIKKAEMDGWVNSQLLGDLKYPAGIVVDLSSDPSRLFWVEYKGDMVRSCNLDGSNVRTILNLPSGSYPWGLAILKDRLFWGHYWAYSIHSSRKYGGDVRTVYTGTHRIQHFTVATSNPSKTRQNHCEGHGCAGVCVLDRSSGICKS